MKYQRRSETVEAFTFWEFKHILRNGRGAGEIDSADIPNFFPKHYFYRGFPVIQSLPTVYTLKLSKTDIHLGTTDMLVIPFSAEPYVMSQDDFDLTFENEQE